MLRNSHWGSSECTPILPITTNGLLFLNIFSLRGRIWSHGSGCQEIFKSLLLVSISELNPHLISTLTSHGYCRLKRSKKKPFPTPLPQTSKSAAPPGNWPCPSCQSWKLRSPRLQGGLGYLHSKVNRKQVKNVWFYRNTSQKKTVVSIYAAEYVLFIY